MIQAPRRRPPRRYHLSLGGVILLLLLVGLLLVAFTNVRGILRQRSASAAASATPSQPLLPPGTSVAVNIQQGESITDIAKELQASGLVANDTVFIGFVKLKGQGTTFQPGVHVIPAGSSMDDIVTELDTPVTPKEVRITLPEGRRIEEDQTLAIVAGVTDAQSFAQLAQHPDSSLLSYSFLADKPPDAGLEGYLFPDTYQLPPSPKSADLIQRMLDNFDKRLTPDIRAQISGRKQTIFNTLIIASIVEREAKVPEERPLIAGAYWNRLDAGMGLFADPTVQYAVGKSGNWWPQLSTNDLKANSPYNTYTHQGLPPGPIADPGLASIQAAAQPQGDYLYFVAKNDGSGSHAFAKTLAEHNANRAKYGQ